MVVENGGWSILDSTMDWLGSGSDGKLVLNGGTVSVADMFVKLARRKRPRRSMAAPRSSRWLCAIQAIRSWMLPGKVVINVIMASVNDYILTPDHEPYRNALVATITTSLRARPRSTRQMFISRQRSPWTHNRIRWQWFVGVSSNWARHSSGALEIQCRRCDSACTPRRDCRHVRLGLDAPAATDHYQRWQSDLHPSR